MKIAMLLLVCILIGLIGVSKQNGLCYVGDYDLTEPCTPRQSNKCFRKCVNERRELNGYCGPARICCCTPHHI